jgi:hypothetical protein
LLVPPADVEPALGAEPPLATVPELPPAPPLFEPAFEVFELPLFALQPTNAHKAALASSAA